MATKMNAIRMEGMNMRSPTLLACAWSSVSSAWRQFGRPGPEGVEDLGAFFAAQPHDVGQVVEVGQAEFVGEVVEGVPGGVAGEAGAGEFVADPVEGPASPTSAAFSMACRVPEPPPWRSRATRSM